MTDSAKPPKPPSDTGPLPTDEEAIRAAVAALAARLVPDGPAKSPPPRDSGVTLAPAVTAPAARDEPATVIPGKAAAPPPAEAPKPARTTRAAALLPTTTPMGPPTVPRSRRGVGGLVLAVVVLLLLLGGGAWLLRDHPQVASLLGRDGVPASEPKQATAPPQSATPAPQASPTPPSPKPDSPPPAASTTAPPTAATPDPAPPAAATPDPTPPAPAPTQAAPAEPAKPDIPPPAIPAEPPKAAAPSPSPAEPAKADPAAAPPTFDNVFVRDGRAVISGRAPAGARVEVRLGARTMATVEADARGEWVAIIDAPLPPGGHELHLVQTPPGGAPVASDRTVAVVIPQPAEPPPPQVATPPVASTPAPSPAEPAKPDAPPQASPPPAATPAPPTTAAPSPPAAVPTPAPASPAAPAPPLVVATPTTPGGASQVLQSPPLARAGDLVLGTVDYDDVGRMTISGQATPGETVRVYLNNQRLGDATAGGDGKWTLVPPQAAPHGPQRLRVDRLGAGGAGVAHRLEVPFERVKLKPGDSVTIVRGDNLWNIARGALGGGERFTAIYEANRNQIRNPDLIYPGQVFVIPKPQ